MQEADLTSDEMKRKNEEVMKYQMQAKRSDLALDHEMKKDIKATMYSCIKCKGEKVSMYTQQTRGADEPMTEFYNCFDCGKQWRICP